jgi:hypothetical protein
MIIITQDLALKLAEIRGANNGVIGIHNLLTAASVSADSEQANYPVTNLANPATDLTQRWKSDSLDLQKIIVQTDEAQVDYIGIARHNFGSGEIIASVEYPDPEDEEETIELVPEYQVANDDVLMFRFDALAPGEIHIKLNPTADQKPWASVIYVGKLLTLQRGIYVGHTPIPFARNTEVQNGIAQSGDFIGQIVTNETLSNSVKLQNLTPDWYRDELDPFIREARSRSGVKPFFFAWRPQKYPNEVGYAWLADNAQPVNQRTNGMMQIDLPLGALST